MDTTIPSSDRPISIDGPRLPAVSLFDVNETLSDMSPVAARFVAVGAPAPLASTWFAALLRDGFARAPGAYAYAAQQCGVEPIDMMLVAVHPWDIDGAHRAGLGTAWINRTGATDPDYLTPPTIEATSVLHLAQLLSQ